MLESATFRSIGASAAGAACLATAFAEPAPAELDARWKNEVLPLVQTYCHDCHGDGLNKGELAIDRYDTIAEMQQHREVWKRIRDHIRHRLMPPPDEDQPNDAERAKLLAWIDDTIFWFDPNKPDPGRAVWRRLNRTEYNNTIRDLLLVDMRPANEFPPDDTGYGYDNIGDVLALSPLLMEKYLRAANAITEKITKNLVGALTVPSKRKSTKSASTAGAASSSVKKAATKELDERAVREMLLGGMFG